MSKSGSEFVFFGRLETRKGLEIFCDQVDALALRSLDKEITITFLGKSAHIGNLEATEYIMERASTWPFEVKILTTMDRRSALEYLEGAGRVTVSVNKTSPLISIDCAFARRQCSLHRI